MFFLDGVGHSSSSSFARNFLGVVVPRLCLPHHLYKSMYIYTQYIVRNAGVHLALPFIFVLKVHWLWQKAFQILPSSLYITFVSLQRTYRSEIVNLRSICGIAGERIQGSMRVSNAQRMTLLAPPHPPHPAHVEVCAAGMMHLWNCRRTYTRPACV